MKRIEHRYSANLDWVGPFAALMEGKVDGNFIIIPEEIHSGVNYFLDCGDGITTFYIDVKFNKDLHLIQKNMNNDFIGIYYNLTEGETTLSGNDFKHNIGRWQYNLYVIDSALNSNYYVKTGSTTFLLCIFIKKNTIQSYAKKNNISFRDIDKITDPKKNTIVRFDRMSSESFHILDDLRKLKVGGPIFDLHLTASVHLLLSNYLKKMSIQRIIIQTINEYDLASIINIQKFLIDTVDDHFPSITQMSSMANMSESKFKNIFKKITGITPNTFFMDNKLLKAKELLEGKQLSISQVSDNLNFSNNSHFASKFKDHFGISPKAFISQL